MKRILLTLCAVMVAVTLQAQEHMSFKGISMGGNLSTFVSALKNQGFIQEDYYDNMVILKGDFAGKSDCTIVVGATENTKSVWKVVVTFPEKVSWYSLKSEYKSFKESYNNKYGKGRSYEYFSDPYYEGDGYELQALRLEKCTYMTFYETAEGNIMLEISDDKSVAVHYEDKITTAIKDREEEQSVSSDI